MVREGGPGRTSRRRPSSSSAVLVLISWAATRLVAWLRSGWSSPRRN